MPLPAGTGLSRRSFVTQSVGAVLAVYGASRLGFSAFEEGIAAAATGPGQPVLVSVFLEGGADALSVLSPQGDPLYHKLRPKLGLAGGTVFAEDDRLHWHPAANALAQLHSEQKVSVMPAIGYTNADQSHFTSRHYWEVGATSTNLRPAGSDAISTASERWTTRCRACRSTTRSHLRSRRRRCRWRRSTHPTSTTSGAIASGARSRRECSSAIGALGATGGDPAFAAAAGVTAQVDRLRNQLLPFQGVDGKPGYTSPLPTRSPRTRSRAGSPGSPRCSQAACRCTLSR